MCTDTVISLYRGRFYARSAQFTSLYREYRYIEDRYIVVLSHTFYCNFCRDIAYSLLYRGYRYIEDRYIGVALYFNYNLSTRVAGLWLFYAWKNWPPSLLCNVRFFLQYRPRPLPVQFLLPAVLDLFLVLCSPLPVPCSRSPIPVFRAVPLLFVCRSLIPVLYFKFPFLLPVPFPVTSCLFAVA